MLWLMGVLALSLVRVAAGPRYWVSDTFNHVLCDDLLPYPNATLRVGVVPYKVHFYWCNPQILSAVVVGRFGRVFNMMIGQVRNEENRPIGRMRSHRRAYYKAYNCHGMQTTVCMNRSQPKQDFTLFWNAPNNWNATLHNSSFMLTIGKPLNLWRLTYRLPEFTGDPATNPPPESYEIVKYPP